MRTPTWGRRRRAHATGCCCSCPLHTLARRWLHLRTTTQLPCRGAQARGAQTPALGHIAMSIRLLQWRLLGLELEGRAVGRRPCQPRWDIRVVRALRAMGIYKCDAWATHNKDGSGASLRTNAPSTAGAHGWTGVRCARIKRGRRSAEVSERLFDCRVHRLVDCDLRLVT